MRRFGLVIAAAALLTACATSAPAPSSATYTPPPTLRQNVRIAFADFGGVRGWSALPDGSLLIESRQNRYYRATFFSDCPELSFTPSIGFLNDLVGSLDRFSGVVVRDRVCRFQTLDEVADPRATQAPAAPGAPRPATP